MILLGGIYNTTRKSVMLDRSGKKYVFDTLIFKNSTVVVCDNSPINSNVVLLER